MSTDPTNEFPSIFNAYPIKVEEIEEEGDESISIKINGYVDDKGKEIAIKVERMTDSLFDDIGLNANLVVQTEKADPTTGLPITEGVKVSFNDLAKLLKVSKWELLFRKIFSFIYEGYSIQALFSASAKKMQETYKQELVKSKRAKIEARDKISQAIDKYLNSSHLMNPYISVEELVSAMRSISITMDRKEFYSNLIMRKIADGKFKFGDSQTTKDLINSIYKEFQRQLEIYDDSIIQHHDLSPFLEALHENKLYLGLTKEDIFELY